MVAAGIAQGLPADIALNLARTTVAGAGALAGDGSCGPSPGLPADIALNRHEQRLLARAGAGKR